MTSEEKRIAEYAKDTYRRTFTKKTITRDARGKISSTQTIEIDPIVRDGGNHWAVYSHPDASPIILSKNV